MKFEGFTFNELARIEIDDTRDIVLSEMLDHGQLRSYTISTYIRLENYEGFKKGAIVIPADMIDAFTNMFSHLGGEE